jgi:leucyl aminopeptidase (aminopeptidase T)
MRDPRDEQYARILVETCIDVQPGSQVIVVASPLARPLLAGVCRAIARRSAYALVSPCSHSASCRPGGSTKRRKTCCARRLRSRSTSR